MKLVPSKTIAKAARGTAPSATANCAAREVSFPLARSREKLTQYTAMRCPRQNGWDYSQFVDSANMLCITHCEQRGIARLQASMVARITTDEARARRIADLIA